MAEVSFGSTSEVRDQLRRKSERERSRQAVGAQGATASQGPRDGSTPATHTSDLSFPDGLWMLGLSSSICALPERGLACLQALSFSPSSVVAMPPDS